MADDAADKQRNGVGAFETNVSVTGVIGKNSAVEIRVTFKHVAAGHRIDPEAFVDVREYWFRDGPTESPVPTRKGIMVKRSAIVDLMKLLLAGLSQSEISDEDARLIHDEIDRCSSGRR